METRVASIIANGKPTELNFATVTDLEGKSIICTFSSPVTAKSYALFEKLKDAAPSEDDYDGLALRACRALFEREPSVCHVIYKDYLLSRGSGDCQCPEYISEGEPVECEPMIERGLAKLADMTEKHRRFEAWLAANRL